MTKARTAIRVYVPRDAAALSMGADSVARAIAAEAKKRGDKVEIVRNGSRGMLWLEPLVEVETPEGRIAYGPVKTSDVEDLFGTGFLEGKAHRLCHGLTAEIPYFKNQERLTFARVGLIDPLSIEDYRKYDGYVGLTKAMAMEPIDIVDQVTKSGLRGRGGAAFPTGIKWKTVHDTHNAQKYICCNADEGDSGTFADRMLMEGDPFCLIEGMTIAGIAVGATKGYIYVRSEYPHAVDTLREAIRIANRANWLGRNIQGSPYHFDLEVRMGAGAYVCGEETSMLESIEGRRGLVRYKPPLPAIEGLFGKPTVINNVLSLGSVPIILDKGADYYRDFGMGRSRGTLAFQLAGNIKQGGLVEKAFGVTARELIEGYGAGTLSGRPIRAVQFGGPLGAYLPEHLLDTPMDYEEFTKVDALVGHGGIVVFDDTVDMAAMARFAMEFCTIESCGKCTPCRIGSTRGVETMDRIIGGIERERNIEILTDLCETMTDGSLCAMGGLTPMPVMSALRHFPEDFHRPVQAAAAE
ncbi:formate dehydrogenase beta subunit [Hyphomicrobium sulfonivorans]|uniref:formate dehydrogenase beta subunit n=1 Tax=Hyphomicrobium sulfonivorans TaxID=121290 RepID=UPI0015706678|nr:NADH-quinone oxidoreductase subunit NuoF [Hyphomicrobium sulfonivorans]MBI1649040.1 NADH-quinone oxidoreductase subunit NuoF [Hyphomicrobium sulfonivorans]NSL70426.1 formate dehydrogenase [Hyphomicrobium sulfonivorans]